LPAEIAANKITVNKKGAARGRSSFLVKRLYFTYPLLKAVSTFAAACRLHVYFAPG